MEGCAVEVGAGRTRGSNERGRRIAGRRLAAASRAALLLASLIEPGRAAAQPHAALEPRTGLATISGTVVDASTGRPVEAATIDVTPRKLTRRGGAIGDSAGTSTAPVAVLEAIDPTTATVASARTSRDGRFRVAVAFTTGQPFVKLDVAAPGYRPTGHVLVRLAATRDTSVSFELIARDLDPQQLVELQSDHARARARIYADLETSIGAPAAVLGGIAPETSRGRRAGDRTARRARRARTFAASGTEYAVPEDVFVASLPGSQFTGFIDFDEFIAGVVAAEMGDTFPFEALKVQAVASRTFALERHERTGTANGGQAYTPFFSDLGQSHVAARNTSGGVLIHDGVPPTAFFSARCNGDFTLASEDGLSCIPSGCGNPCTVGGLLPGASPLPYVRSRACSGHVSCALTTEPCCTVFADGRTQHLFGHGVGMCQRGAQELACRDGVAFEDILAGYYTDVALANRPGVAPGARVATTAGLNARAAPCDSDRIVVAQNTAGTVMGGPLRQHCTQLGSCVGNAGTYWTWWQVDFDDGTGGRWVVEDFLEQIAPASTADAACARPVSGATTPQVTDCLLILRAAVGLSTCEPACACAPTGTLPPSSADALLCLVGAVGLPAVLDCPCP